VNARVIKVRRGTIIVRPLQHGDVDTVLAVFHRLGPESRRRRFNGPKPRLSEHELWQLARVDANHHALVAHVEGDREPVALARLVRSGSSAEIAFEVASEHQQRGIGAALTDVLLEDARAAGITEITALVSSDNPAALALLRRALDALEISFEGRDIWITAALPRAAGQPY